MANAILRELDYSSCLAKLSLDIKLLFFFSDIFSTKNKIKCKVFSVLLISAYTDTSVRVLSVAQLSWIKCLKKVMVLFLPGICLPDLLS